MRKHKKKVVTYHLAGIDTETPITREQLESFHELSMFFVSSDGLVVPITSYTDHAILSCVIGGKYMYKNQLEDLVFNS